MQGMLCSAVNAMSCMRWLMKNAPEETTRRPTRLSTSILKAASICSGVEASTAMRLRPRLLAAALPAEKRRGIFGVLRISHQRCGCGCRNGLVEEGQSFCDRIDIEPTDAGQIAPRPVKALHEAGLHRVFAAD